MTKEEKAKAYDEALKRAMRLYEQGTITESLSYVFPELKESEDERIRKAIIATIHLYYGEPLEDEAKEMIAWLEKQGKQKPKGKSAIEAIKEEKVDNANKVEPKFKVGDVMRTTQEAADGIKGGMPVVVSIDEEYYHCNNELIAIKDQDSYEYPSINRRQKTAWSEEDEAIWAEISDLLREGYKQSDSKFSWDDIRNWVNTKLLKGRVQPQKQEWSEEDLNKIENALFGTYAVDVATRLLNKIKSLRPQSQWKPSDEQMDNK